MLLLSCTSVTQHDSQADPPADTRLLAGMFLENQLLVHPLSPPPHVNPSIAPCTRLLHHSTWYCLWHATNDETKTAHGSDENLHGRKMVYQHKHT
jgi:hypothetical protein